MGAAVTHFEIISRNGEAMKSFYAKLFGWAIDSSNPMNYGLVKGEGKGIGGGIASPEGGSEGYVAIYAEVPDPQATLDLAVSLGGTVIVPVTEIPNMVTFALFADPDGNKMGIVKAMPEPPKRAATKKAPARKKAAPARTAKKATRKPTKKRR
jgi:uncharacterized protein